MREFIVERLRTDLVGPFKPDEVLESRPSDVYLTGILWPHDARMGAEEDDRLADTGGDGDENEAGGGDEGLSLPGLGRPCSAGVSIAIRAEADPELDIVVDFATYEPIDAPETDTAETGKRKQTKDKSGKEEPGEEKQSGGAARRRRTWHRRAHKFRVDNVTLGKDDPKWIDLTSLGAPPGAKLHIRTVPWSGGILATVTLLNKATAEQDERSDGIERLALFQTRIELSPRPGTVLVARPSRRATLDDDDRSAALLYRNAREFATGHTCSVDWDPAADGATANMVATTWTPEVKVPATSAAGHKVFAALRTAGNIKPLSARWLAMAPSEDLGEALQQLPAAYNEWIEDRAAEVASLPEELREQARKNIQNCRAVHGRIEDGATRIATDPNMLRSFQLANLAMDVQHGWDPEKSARGPLEWRPFQLGFILLAAASAADRGHPDRGIMDLLWFPTGGGKTEAYLALIALLAFHRRLAAGDDPDAGAGVAAIMRYTLRLLTTQQFKRATAVLLACDAIRRGRIPEAGAASGELGLTPFSTGLWVGAAAVPNKVSDAAAALSGAPDQPTPKQLVDCPACRAKLTWAHNKQAGAIHACCKTEDCLLFDPDAPLPIWTVDEDVYRARPTLLIGTIDKFAQIVRSKEIHGLFGLDTGTPPDLILQDELHLISGPLGTITGLYEVVIDRMFTVAGARPKIIGSTATIRRASEQVQALFNRETTQFPPACLDARDSAFSVVVDDAPGRVYTGVTTAGRSPKFVLQAVAASLLQSASSDSMDDAERDPYWTLVSYFNSLRELGGALVLMQDDVNNSLAILAKQHGEAPRHPELVEELTSRRTQADVRDMLDRLGTPAGTQGALDVVLATNMLSVGVDIPRLGLMLVNGQPKGITEYIQATSRVGRGNVPGLIVAVLNNGRARDRSHYESFSTWHHTLYRDVEPMSVTPFASRARDRALHAVLVGLVRHLVPEMLDHPRLDNDAIDAAKDLIDHIVQRAREIDPQERSVKAELEKCLDTWEVREPQSYWSQKGNTALLQDAERAATLRAMGRVPGLAWPTLNSMRSVEPATPFRLAERLSQQTGPKHADDE